MQTRAAGTRLFVSELAGIEAAGRALLARGPNTVIVTLGGEGALAVGQGARIRLEGHRVSVVDTTGAGDCFVGALAAGLAEGLGLAAALAMANRAAALSVTRPGAAVAMPTRAEVTAASAWAPG